MLRQRILTALVLVPLILAAVLYMPTDAFGWVLAPITTLGAWEWARLGGLTTAWVRALYALVVTLLLPLAGLLMGDPAGLPIFLAGACLWWLFATYSVVRYRGQTDTEGVQFGYLLSGLLVLSATWVAVVGLHGLQGLGPEYVVILLLLVWAADTGAYFAGRRWGKRKLAPLLSPGKTREGLYGGLATSFLVIILASQLLDLHGLTMVFFVVVSLITTVMSVVGDLLESLLKRQRGVKDSGHLLPGHGGVLDRIDSITAAAPVFLFGLLLGTVA